MSTSKSDELNMRDGTPHVFAGSPLLIRSGTLSNAILITFNHGEATRPDLWWGELTIVVAEDGYAAGDVLKIERSYEEDENNHGLTLWANATQIGISQDGTDEIQRNTQKTGAIIFSGLANIEIRLVGVWF